MKNNLEILEVSEDVIRQYINSKSAFTALEQAKLRATEFRGGMIWKNVKGKDYLVRTSTRGNQTGLGSKSDITQAIYEKFISGKTSAEEFRSGLKKSIIQHERLNRALRVGRTPSIIVEILNAIEKAGIADKFMIIGTNALYAYETSAGVLINERHLATNDVDLLWDNRKRLSLATKENALVKGMLGILKNIDPSFKLRDDQLYTAVNKDGYEVDIFRRIGHDNNQEPSRLSTLEDDFWAVKAKNADWLLSAPKFSEIVVATNGKMARMTTVDPRAFVLFKLWMAEQVDRDPLKRTRDSSQAKIVFDLIGSYLPQFNFAELKIFPNKISEWIITDSDGIQKIKIK